MTYAGAAEAPESAAVNIRNRRYTIAVEVDIESADACGVLFRRGARFGGHALYVAECRLAYVGRRSGWWRWTSPISVDAEPGDRGRPSGPARPRRIGVPCR